MSDTPDPLDPEAKAPPASDYIEPPPADYIPPPLDPQAMARAAGYSWPEIKDHIAASTADAINFGYTEPEIDAHLGYQDPTPMRERATQQWRGAFANDPSILDTIEPQGRFDLASSPNIFGDYAEALRDRTAKGSRDFAYEQAAAAVNAAQDFGLSTDNAQAVEQRKVAAAGAAEDLAARLPRPEDLTDAALMLAGAVHDAFGRIQGNLLDHWRDTGQDPLRAAMAADFDPELKEQLRAPPEPPAPPWYARFGAGWGDMFSGATEMIEKAVPGVLHGPGAGMTEYSGADELLWRMDQPQLPNDYFADAAKARLQELRASGIPDDDWLRIGGQITATVPLATTLGLSGVWGWMAAGATGSAAMAAFTPSEAENYWTEKSKDVAISGVGGAAGGAVLAGGFKLLGKLISKMAPDAADHLAYLFRTLKEPEVPITDPAAKPGTAPRMVPASEAFKPVEPARLEVTPPVEGTEPAPPRFAEDATPASKIERVAQDAPENAPASPTYFQDRLTMLGITDPETLALAEAHDTSGSYLNWLKNVFSDLMTDESGRLRLFPAKAPPAPSEERGAVILGKNEADRLIRQQANGMAMQTVEHIKQGFEPMRKIVAPHLPEWEAGLQKVYDAKGQMAVNAAVDALKNTTIGRYVQAVEGRGVIDPNSPLAPLVQLRQALNGIVDKDLGEAIAKGDLQAFQMRDFYLAHIYDMGNAPVGGRGGSVGFTRARTYDDYFEALAEGHKLRFTNPIDIDIASDQAKLNALSTLRVQALAKDNNFIRSFSDPKAVDPGWLPLTGLMSKKQVGLADGNVVTHQLYAPPGFSRLYNNHIGFQDYTNASTTLKNFEDGLLRMKNLSTHLKLLLPLYHSVAEYKEGIAAGIGNSLIELGGGLRGGDIGEMLRGMRDMALAPVKPIQYVYQGGTKWRPMYRAAEQDPALAALNPELKAMQAFVAGGGNIARRDNVYQESRTPTIWQSWARGELGQELRKDVTGVTSISDAVGLPFHELARLSTSLSAPIWDHFIPLLKSGAAMERIQTYLRQNPNASEDAVNFFAKQVVTQMEDRFGEYNMNNLFWRPALRRITNQAMLSTSWTYGTVHSLLTGLGWNPGRGMEWNPVASADLAGHLATIAFTNAAWTYGIDGKLPDNYYDYLIPFANARGVKRVLLPGQEKEFYDWLGVIRKSVSVATDHGLAAGFREFTGQFAHYAFGKAAPIYQAAAGWLMGEDGIGHDLDAQPGGPVAYLKNVFLPIFVTAWDQAKADGLTPVESLFGIRGAPKWFEKWDEFRAQEQKRHARATAAELQRAGREAIAQGNEVPEGYRPSIRGTPLDRSQSAHDQRLDHLYDTRPSAGHRRGGGENLDRLYDTRRR